MLSIIYGLLSAIGWGAADFTGGLASKKSSPYQVLFLAEIAGILPLVVIVLLVREPLPSLPAWLWSGLASTVGTLGLLILYRALAEGQMTIAAPVSALLAAIIPVLVGALTEGLPRPVTLLGFGLALASVWIISQNGETKGLRLNLRGLRLPLISGLFFGAYFVLIHQATTEAFYWPLVSARLAGTLVMLIYAAAVRGTMLPKRSVWPIVILGGMLDVIGNVFYVFSANAGRMDTASVLGALYPASTVVLAWVILHERLSRSQWVGIALCLLAIILMTI